MYLRERWEDDGIMVKIQKDKNVKARRGYIRVRGRKVPLLILSPKNSAERRNGQGRTGVLWIHGGGYILGMKEMVYMGRAVDLVKKFGVVVIAPDYHLAFSHPYPAAIEDCYGALLYMKRHCGELGIRSDQLMVGGESAGGGLTASLCMLARDRREVGIAYQMPLYPMLDNLDTESSWNNHARIWNTRRNHFGWRMYLREHANQKVSPYAAAARQTNYANLPPAYTFVGTAEPFYCETVTYIQNLKAAGVEASIDIYPDMYHAFDMMEPDNPISRQAIDNFETHFSYAVENYYAEQIS